MDTLFKGISLDSYESYLYDCEKYGVTNVLSLEEFNSINDPNFSLRFVNPANVITGLGAIATKNRDRIVRAASQGPIPLRDEAIKIVLEEGINQARSIKFNKGSEDGTPKSDLPGDDPSNRLLGNYDVTPIKVEFKPGILNRSYTSDVNLPTQRYATTHLLGAGVTIPEDSAIAFYFDNTLIPWLQQKAQSSVNFKIDLSYISKDKVRKYLKDNAKALNIYYFYTSLISYCVVPTNRDLGLTALRNMISVQDVDYLNQLKQLLSSIPIPPNLNTACFFMNQNFMDSPDGDGLFKFMPISFNTNTDSNGTVTGFSGSNSSVLTSCITDLNSTDNREIASLLNRIAPNWINPKIYEPSSVPMFSKTALTVFANFAHYYWWGGANYVGPVAANADTVVSYLSMDPNLDGAALALTSQIIGSEVIPCLCRPINSLTTLSSVNYSTNRFSYVYSTSTDSYVWRPSNRSIEAAFGRPERSRAYQGTEYYAKLPGSLRLSNLTINTMQESVKDMLSWMMSIETIPNAKIKNNNWTKRKSTTSDERVDNK